MNKILVHFIHALIIYNTSRKIFSINENTV